MEIADWLQRREKNSAPRFECALTSSNDVRGLTSRHTHFRIAAMLPPGSRLVRRSRSGVAPLQPALPRARSKTFHTIPCGRVRMSRQQCIRNQKSSLPARNATVPTDRLAIVAGRSSIALQKHLGDCQSLQRACRQGTMPSRHLAHLCCCSARRWQSMLLSVHALRPHSLPSCAPM